MIAGEGVSDGDEVMDGEGRLDGEETNPPTTLLVLKV